MRTSLTVLILTAATWMQPAAGAEFTFGDWTLACDNTGRCEAVGFQEEGGEPVALRLSRDAGPGARLQAQMLVEVDNDDYPAEVSVTMGTFKLDDIPVEKDIPSAQLKPMLTKMLNAGQTKVHDETRTWTLSLRGLKATLLKMDELQGRIDTPGALVRQGSKPENTVPAARPVPVFAPAKPAPSFHEDRKLSAAILKTIEKGGCAADPDVHGVYKVSPGKLVIVRVCGQGAYQRWHQLWIANAKPPFSPQQIVLPMIGKETADTVVEADFDGGVLHSHSKGRGIGDCGTTAEWLWTADGFKLLSLEQASACRGFPGGVPLKQWIAKKGRSD